MYNLVSTRFPHSRMNMAIEDAFTILVWGEAGNKMCVCVFVYVAAYVCRYMCMYVFVYVGC